MPFIPDAPTSKAATTSSFVPDQATPASSHLMGTDAPNFGGITQKYHELANRQAPAVEEIMRDTEDATQKGDYLAGGAPSGGMPSALMKNAGTRIATAGGLGGLIGGSMSPQGDETRLGNAAKRAALSAGAATLGEGAYAGYGAAKGILGAIRPTPQPQFEQRMGEQLAGKNVNINPSDYVGRDPAIDAALAPHRPQTTPQESFQVNAENKYPSQMDVPASDFDKLRQLIGKKVEYSPNAWGKPVPTNQGMADMSAKAIGQEHALSPEIDDLLATQHANLTDNQRLQKAKDMLVNQGHPFKAGTLATAALGGGAVKGAYRASSSPTSDIPTKLSALLQGIQAKKSQE